MLEGRLIEIGAIITIAVLLLLLVPKNKIREASLIFMFKQLMTWFFGLMVVEHNLIEYPARFFKNATRQSFTFEYFVFPGLCVLFNLYYPENKSKFRQILHFILFTTGMTVFEVVLERYTQVINYIHWHWYWTWITEFILFGISRMYYLWFFRRNKVGKA